MGQTETPLCEEWGFVFLQFYPPAHTEILAVCSALTHGSVVTHERLSAVGSDYNKLSDRSSPVETERKDGSNVIKLTWT